MSPISDFALASMRTFAFANERELGGRFVALDESLLRDRIPRVLTALRAGVRNAAGLDHVDGTETGFLCSLREKTTANSSGIVLKLVLGDTILDYRDNCSTEDEFFDRLSGELEGQGNYLAIFKYFIRKSGAVAVPGPHDILDVAIGSVKDYLWTNPTSRRDSIRTLKEGSAAEGFVQRLVLGLLIEDEERKGVELLAPNSRDEEHSLTATLGLYLSQLGVSASDIERADGMKTRAISSLVSHAMKIPLAGIQLAAVSLAIKRASSQLETAGSEDLLAPLRDAQNHLEHVRRSVDSLREFIPLFDDLGGAAIRKVQAIEVSSKIRSCADNLGGIELSQIDGLEELEDTWISFSPPLFGLLLRECFRNAQAANDTEVRWRFEGEIDRSSGLFKLTVANSGRPIEPAVRRKLFHEIIPEAQRTNGGEEEKRGAGQALWAIGRVFLDLELPLPRAQEALHPITRGPSLEFWFPRIAEEP